MEAIGSYSRYCITGDSSNVGEGQEKAIVVDDRTATLEDGTRLRLTPREQKTVDQLVSVGDYVAHNYGEGRKVTSIGKYFCYGLPVFTVTFADKDAKPNKDGSYRENDLGWTNECVAQDNRILRLFYANKEETFIVKTTPQSRLDLF